MIMVEYRQAEERKLCGIAQNFGLRNPGVADLRGQL
jgi:hypothetical protein